jgi:NAD(P)-dependent dehydrogenase (short-subunit alcohol dehydrogenase family)
MPSVLISGASRGLGLEFARQYAADGWQVHATCRDPDNAPALKTLTGDVVVHKLEVTERASLDALAQAVKPLALDVLIASAGVTGPRGMTAELVDRESWIETLAINTIAPLALAGTLQRNLEKGKQKKVVAISSRLGSIASNENGSLYTYRSSKAALNATWKSLSIDWRGFGMICVVLHPGWVATDMGGPGADIQPPESIAGMRKVIAGLVPEDTGKFLSYNGAPVPW